MGLEIPEQLKREDIISEFIILCNKENISSFAEDRGYNINVLKDLKIGKCSIDVMNFLMNKYDKQDIKDAGLIDGSSFKFLNRIIIPYSKDYFAGRREHKREDDKYKNLFLKGLKKELYFVKGDNKKCIILEGETSLISAKHLFPEYNICSIGGSTSYNLLKNLKNHFDGNEVLICFDNDEAGDKCYNESLKIIGCDYNLKKINIPKEYNDIDELHKEKGKEAIKDIKFSDVVYSPGKPNKTEKINSIKKGVKKGFRNESAFDLAKEYNKKGNDLREAKLLMVEWNLKNEPPLSQTELNSVIESAYKKTKKELEDDTIFTSLYINKEKNLFAEQVYNGKISMFCIYNTGTEEIKYSDNIIEGDKTYKPIEGEEVEKKAIFLSSEAKDYGTDKELDKDILDFIKKWLDVSEETLMFAKWNIKRSWVYERFNSINYLRALGQFGEGKSRYLNTLGYLHYKAIRTSGATTPAPVFRIIDKWRGTLIMDEADFKKSDESQDMIKIINLGFEKGNQIMRCEQNDANKVNFFDPYCPKILATRREFEDKATESRCITEVMKGTTREDIPVNLDDDFFIEAEGLRNKLLMWRFKNYYKIDLKRKIDIDMNEIEPRIRQMVSSLIPLFNTKEEIKIFIKFVNEKQEEVYDQRRNSYEGQVVNGIYELIKEGELKISSQDIIEKGDIKNKAGLLVKPRSITTALRTLGFGKNKSIRIGDKIKRVIPLDQEMIIKLFKKYDLDCNGVTVVTVVTETSLKDDFKEKPPLIINNNKLFRPTKNRNNRNTVTEKTDPKLWLCNKLKDKKTIETQALFDNFPKEDKKYLEEIIQRLKDMMVIFEPTPGHLKSLE